MESERGTNPPDVGIVVDLRNDGLLWYVNASLFHPRGFALAVRRRQGQPYEFRLLGDGSEPWRFDPSTEPTAGELFRRVNAMFGRARRGG